MRFDRGPIYFGEDETVFVTWAGTWGCMDVASVRIVKTAALSTESLSETPVINPPEDK